MCISCWYVGVLEILLFISHLNREIIYHYLTRRIGGGNYDIDKLGHELLTYYLDSNKPKFKKKKKFEQLI